MRIGIITQPLHTNYGGLLQNYALQQVLRKFGHEVYTINRTYPRDIYTLPATKQIKFLTKQTIKKFLGKTYSPTKNDISRITEKCRRFIEENITVTNKVKTQK